MEAISQARIEILRRRALIFKILPAKCHMVNHISAFGHKRGHATHSLLIHK
jgi:hypothetical protein